MSSWREEEGGWGDRDRDRGEENREARAVGE